MSAVQDLAQDVAERAADMLYVRGNPFQVLYHKPNSLSLTWFAKFAQRYCHHKAYTTLLQAADATGYEPVPSPLLYRNHSKWKGRRVRVGTIAFYLIKPEEMPTGLKDRYNAFLQALNELNPKNEGA